MQKPIPTTHALAIGLAASGLVLAPLSRASAETRTVNTLMLKDSGEIADAMAVNAALDALVNDANACSPRTQACICNLTAGMDKLDAAYRDPVARHPGWGQPNTGVEFRNPVKGGTTGIVMSNVKRQLAMCGRQ